MTQELLPGTCELIRDLLLRLHRGDSFDNPKLRRLAEQAFGGTRTQGVYTSRDAYDALEAAVNQLPAVKTLQHTVSVDDYTEALPELTRASRAVADAIRPNSGADENCNSFQPHPLWPFWLPNWRIFAKGRHRCWNRRRERGSGRVGACHRRACGQRTKSIPGVEALLRNGIGHSSLTVSTLNFDDFAASGNRYRRWF